MTLAWLGSADYFSLPTYALRFLSQTLLSFGFHSVTKPTLHSKHLHRLRLRLYIEHGIMIRLARLMTLSLGKFIGEEEWKCVAGLAWL